MPCVGVASLSARRVLCSVGVVCEWGVALKSVGVASLSARRWVLRGGGGGGRGLGMGGA